jgi:hypothetical protein
LGQSNLQNASEDALRSFFDVWQTAGLRAAMDLIAQGEKRATE